MCFYENRLFLFLFESLERRAARDLIVPETGENIDGCVRGFVCVCVRVGGAGEAKSKNNTYNQNGSIGA